MHAHRQPDLLDETIGLVEVARSPGGDDFPPDGAAAAPAGDEVVERKPPRRAAVDAAPAVTREEGAAGDLALDRPRHPDVVHEPDHVRPGEGRRGGAEWSLERLDHLRLALEHEHVRAPNRADVQRLIARVQNEYLHPLRNVAMATAGAYRAIARSTASRSSGERATGARP